MTGQATFRMMVGAAVLALATQANAQTDPREMLGAGEMNAGIAAKNLVLISNSPRPAGFTRPDTLKLPQGVPPVIGDLIFGNSDMAFRGDLLFVGSFRGFQVFDVANAQAPKLVSSVVCPGGQGDMSVYRNLLFMSVEMPNGRIDCSDVPLSPEPGPTRFLGVRIFDISDVANPKQVGTVQTCRGSHTHTLVPDARDSSRVFIYVSGTGMPRPASELAGCSGLPPERDPNTSYFRIEVIEVPVAAPQNARIVNSPRIFADTAGNIAGLWRGGRHGADTQETARTDQCHDITAFPAFNLAAGACSGNGILLDISDPANPKRVEHVVDPNFAYWHSATFNNDATKVIFTDEWGGGMAPRCQSTDRREWGANAIFTLRNRDLTHAGYYKLPAAQGEFENCVAHNGSIVPVPGRDIMVQAWYQGGISVLDFTDPSKPFEIAYFDRGPYDLTPNRLAGYWSAYWYNGRIYATEILRGLDILELLPGEQLTRNELDAAKLVEWQTFNPQTQARATWPASFVVARAYVDQLRRAGNVDAARLDAISKELDRLETISAASTLRTGLERIETMVQALRGRASGRDATRLSALAENVRALRDRHSR